MYKETISFIKRLFPNQEFVPLHAPCFIGNEKEYLNDCIDSTFVSSVESIQSFKYSYSLPFGFTFSWS